MPPIRLRRKRTAPSSDMAEVRPQQALNTSTSGLDPDKLAETIATAVRSAMSAGSASQQADEGTNNAASSTVENTVDQDVRDIISTGTVNTGASIEPSSPLFSSITVPLGGRVSAKIRAKIWAEEFIDFRSSFGRFTKSGKIFNLLQYTHWRGHT